MKSALCLSLAVSLASFVTILAAPPPPGLISREFVYETAPFPQCHASTLAETPDGTLVCAWFGGTKEKHPDVGIWTARWEKDRWTAPIEAANGVESAEKRCPCWNPVLFQPPAGPLVLFYKVGPSPDDWWGMVKRSKDGGLTWSEAEKLPDGILGPIKNKALLLADGTLLAGSSTEAPDDLWRVHFERTADKGQTWSKTGPVNDGKTFGLIQPTLLTHADGTLQALCRSRQRHIVSLESKDRGLTWSTPEALDLPNPNSGIDAVTLADGRHLLVYNHVAGDWAARSPLNLALSKDGHTWKAAGILEDEKGEFSYPAVIQGHDGRIHISYTWKRRRIHHVVLDPKALVETP